ncbi:MAG: glycosyltransferase family 1 protein [Promethearchaeota archaeon]|nr:MAG: glycosyltransferase family 1 protein [Candidatus Lokiarchaeota archaeon]
MKKPHICLVSLGVFPDKQDGEARVIRAYYDYLKKKKYNVKLITGKWNIDLEDKNIIQFSLIRKRFFWAPFFTLKTIKFLKFNEFDIIHGNGPKGTIPILLSNKKKFISTIHDLGPFETEFSKIPLVRIIIKKICQKAKFITTVSNFVKKEFEYFLPEIKINKIYNLYNGIDAKFKPYPEEAIKLKKQLKINGPVLLYIGRITSYKGVEEIITAYNIAKRTIPDLNLVIGGKPDFIMEKKYMEWKSEYSDIYFLGFISEKKMPYYYSMGDIFITYSYASEGFGLTSIEAIACGTPVICSSIPVYKEVLQDNAIFVPPKSPNALANEIKNLLENEAYRQNLIMKAQKFIKKYTWIEVGKRLEELYDKYLSE